MSYQTKKKELTYYNHPNLRVRGSSYGDISHHEWCTKEADSINAKGGATDHIVGNERGEIALSR